MPNQDAATRQAGSAGLDIDTSTAHPARSYNWWLGGKDNFAADRASGDAIAMVMPSIRQAARENRRFLRDAVTYLAKERGIRQFLDIGTGLPSAQNTHEVAQAIAPESRVVYADNDKLVLVHARALLTSSPEGRTAYLDADLRDPESILGDPELWAVLDLRQPVALMLVAVLHFLEDADDPYGVVYRLVTALPAGSYVVISHATADHMTAEKRAALDTENQAVGIPFQFRNRAEVTALFEGLELEAPGVVSIADWPDTADGDRPSAADVACYGGIAQISAQPPGPQTADRMASNCERTGFSR